MTDIKDSTAGPWELVPPISIDADEPGLPKFYRDPDEFDIIAKPNGFAVVVATAYSQIDAATIVKALPNWHTAIGPIDAALLKARGGSSNEAE